MALNPTPQRKQIFQFPTPNLDDRVFYELHDSTQMNYTVPEYGTPHPNQSKYAGYVFAHVRSANDSGWVQWFYLNERANQDEYNFEVTYPYADTSYPAYVRTYVLKRENLDEPEAGTPDPVHGAGYILTAHKQTRLSDPVLDSLFVGVQRAYERLPGPVIQSYVVNSRGDVETQNEQVVPYGATIYPDGLNVTKSGLDFESTVKGKQVYSTVSSHAVLYGGMLVDSMAGAIGAMTSKIVPPNSPVPAMGALMQGDGADGYVVSATLSPKSSTKAELKVVTVNQLPSTKKVYYNDRGELETETTKYVPHLSNSGPRKDSLLTTKSQYVQDSVGFGREIYAFVEAYNPLTTISYSSEFKGAKVTEVTRIVAPTESASLPGSSGAGGTVVSSAVVQKSATKAVSKTVAIDKWPTLYDYYFEDELNAWVTVTYEIISATEARQETKTDTPFVEVEYKAIDAYWTAKTTKTVVATTTPTGAQGFSRIDSKEVEYDFPAIFFGLRWQVYVNTKGRDYTTVEPIVLSGLRKYVPAKIHVVYCAYSTPLSRDLNGKLHTPTQFIPVDVRYNGILIKFDAGRCISKGDGECFAFSGTNSQRWNPPLIEVYKYPKSYPDEMPDEVRLPVRVTPWKYNLFKHELIVLDTKLPDIVINNGRLEVKKP